MTAMYVRQNNVFDLLKLNLILFTPCEHVCFSMPITKKDTVKFVKSTI